MQVGTTKDQGFYNKPSAAVHPGTLVAENLPQYNTIQYNHAIIAHNARMFRKNAIDFMINPLNAELNPIRHLLALVGDRHIVHVSRIRVKVISKTFFFLQPW